MTKKLLALLLSLIFIFAAIPAVADEVTFFDDLDWSIFESLEDFDWDSLDLTGASEWARFHIIGAFSAELVPENLLSDYRQNITRLEFAVLAVYWFGRAFDFAGFDEDAYDTFFESVDEREELVAELDDGTFSDTDSEYAHEAFALGIISGTRAPTRTRSGVFSPDANITRQEAAVMLRNAALVLGINVSAPNASFGDRSRVANWARPAVNFVFENGIMSGIGGNNFSPLDNLTREQAITIFHQFVPPSGEYSFANWSEAAELPNDDDEEEWEEDDWDDEEWDWDLYEPNDEEWDWSEE